MPKTPATTVGLSATALPLSLAAVHDSLRGLLRSPQFWESVKVVGVGVAISLTKRATDALWAALYRLFFAQAVFRSRDESYRWVMHYLTQLDAVKTHPRNVEVTSKPLLLVTNEGDADADAADAIKGTQKPGEQGEGGIWLYPLPDETIRFTFDGRLIWASRSRQLVGDSEWDETISLSFLSISSRPIRDFVRNARRLYEDAERGRITVIRTDRYTRWERGKGAAKRPADSLHLDGGRKEMILDDARRFVSRETRRWYADRGVPYRRGYLLHGPPGSGKSSMVSVLASELNVPIYSISLSSSSLDDLTFQELMLDIPSGCIALIEDVDAAFGSRQANADDGQDAESDAASRRNGTPAVYSRLSLATLLNVLDGVGAQEGRLLCLTTNHIERLDPALLRPGRIDVRVEFDNASQRQAYDLFLRWYPHVTPRSNTPRSNSSDLDDNYDDETQEEEEGAQKEEEQQQQQQERKQQQREREQDYADLGERDAEKRGARRNEDDGDPGAASKRKRGSHRGAPPAHSASAPRAASTAASAEAKRLARLFSESVPAHTHSVAALQGYLLTFRGRHARRAALGVGRWLAEQQRQPTPSRPTS